MSVGRSDDSEVVVRNAADADRAFLRHLFIATHPEFAALPADVATTIVDRQYDTREQQYCTRFPTLCDRIIEVDGRPVGRVSTAATDRVIIVVDLAVLPVMQRRGVASAVLGDLVDEADREQRALELSVVDTNPAVRLYERVGFVVSTHAESTGYLRMRRCPR